MPCADHQVPTGEATKSIHSILAEPRANQPTNNNPKSDFLHPLGQKINMSIFSPFPFPSPVSHLRAILPPLAPLNCKPTFILTEFPIFTPLHLQSTREASPPTVSYLNSAPSHRFHRLQQIHLSHQGKQSQQLRQNAIRILDPPLPGSRGPIARR